MSVYVYVDVLRMRMPADVSQRFLNYSKDVDVNAFAVMVYVALYMQLVVHGLLIHI